MLTRQIPSLSDIYTLLNRYSLAAIDWGEATAEGFALHLLANPEEVNDALTLSAAIHRYIGLCLERATRGAVAADAGRTDLEAAELDSQARAWLLEVVRQAKFGTYGGVVWPAIARAATLAPVERLQSTPELGASGAFVDMALTHLKKALCEGFVLETMSYSPGLTPVLDRMVRLDIERLDDALASIAPTQRNPTCSLELSALLALACDQDFREALRSPVAPHL
jgi:hypothetical protein